MSNFAIPSNRAVLADIRGEGWGGGLAEFIVVPRYAVFKIPDSISLEVAGWCYL